MRPQITSSPTASLIRLVFIVCLAGLLNACTKFEYHEAKSVPAQSLPEAENQLIPEDELLDVGIVVLDPGSDLLTDDEISFANVRQSEAVWFASQIKASLQDSNVWGSVRTMPSATSVMDVLVEGKILESNGEFLRLHITARDATGTEWFSEEFSQQASSYAYNPEVSYGKDPFYSMFVEIANKLFDHRVSLQRQELLAIRNVARLRFAQDFVPQAYADFLAVDKGRYSLVRMPARNDPMIMRIERIRARNDLFLDVIQDYYRAFNGNMAHPYQEWRKSSYREVLYARQLREQARNEKIAGVAAILVGVLAQTADSGYARGAGHIGIFAGANLIYQGYAKQNEAFVHSATVRELGAALEAELEPSVIDLEDRSVTLSGTVEEQFREWRRILGEMFLAESGVSSTSPIDSSAVEDSAEDTATSSASPQTTP